MSTTYDELNRLINRAARNVNEVAIKIVDSELPSRSDAVKELSSMLASLTKIRSAVIAEDPELEYHYDSSRQPTTFMKELSRLVEQARKLEARGRFSDAKRVLEKARDLEPPPLTFEELSRRIESLNDK